MNDKYYVTEIEHPTYSFLHRIQAKTNVCEGVQEGDLGGYVESEENLCTDPDDTSWIFDDAISCGNAYVDNGAQLRDQAIARDHAYISYDSVMRDHAMAEDDSYMRYSEMCGSARIAGNAIIRESEEDSPILSDTCVVYGNVSGNLLLSGTTIVLSDESIGNRSKDPVEIKDGVRSVGRSPDRDVLQPRQEARQEQHTSQKAKRRGQER